MGNLLRFEMRKFLRAKSLYICLIVSASMSILTLAANAFLASLTRGVFKTRTFSQVVNFSSTGMISLLLGIFVSIFVCEDMTSGTIKNILGRGYSRLSLYFAKYVMALLATVLYCVTNLFVLFVGGSIMFQWESSVGSLFVAGIFTQIFVMFGFVTLHFMVAEMVGKAGFAIAITVVAPSVVNLFLLMGDVWCMDVAFTPSHYWMDHALSMTQKVYPKGEGLLQSFLITLVYMLLAHLAGILIARRKEV